jgi:flagellar biosynthesis/type III secretory pathway protein FliH
MIDRANIPPVAIDRTINRLPGDFLSKPFLEAHRAEVKNMLLTEYNEAETMEMLKREAREDGLAEGRAEGRAKGLAEGRAEGRAEGEGLLGGLMSRLLSMGRIAEILDAPAEADTPGASPAPLR